MATDYNIEHWTSACTMVGSSKDDAVSIKVNDRAATRQAIITTLARKGYQVIERSSWQAAQPRTIPLCARVTGTIGILSSITPVGAIPVVRLQFKKYGVRSVKI
ncbi:hypothetical protein RI103_31295 [Paraburkholderia sp. FT54]|uniref:hypothetical protein n=1 Tax=Paraburkholderia sp. FT54 TaxID=3074437 RepID=UPI002877A4A4|nr:hypothetical protein [Paraburkholderia sp. FT54]WNC94372.1 hypothetical protein RI103_31295 [Paraburkholderia sp. FT54]